MFTAKLKKNHNKKASKKYLQSRNIREQENLRKMVFYVFKKGIKLILIKNLSKSLLITFL